MNTFLPAERLQKGQGDGEKKGAGFCLRLKIIGRAALLRRPN